MAEHSFPFASVDNDRKYGAADWAGYFSQFISNGVFPVGTQLQVTAGSGMQVNVSDGGAWINGYGYRNDSVLILAIEPADGVLNRIDRVVVRWGRAERTIFLTVLKGTPASTPAPPALVRDADYYDLCIAQIAVNAGITEIAAAHISDKRMDPSLCGIGSSLITPNTAGWYEGWEIEFQTWFDSVKGLMGEDPGTSQAAAISELQGDVAPLKAAATMHITSGTAPDFTISQVPSITAYVDGQMWTLRFHTSSDSPTLNVNGLGAAPLLEATGKAAKVKAGQIVRVMRYGASFFTVSGAGSLPDSISSLLSYTGKKIYEQKVIDGKLYHLFTFETSGILTVTGDFVGDVWMCGGGADGQDGNKADSPNDYGYGGAGAFTANFYNVQIQDGEIAIGAGNGGVTSYLEMSANGATGPNGGSGGAKGRGGVNGTGQGTTTRPWGSADMPAYCPGGGNGATDDAANRYNGGSDGGAPVPASGPYGLGGDWGGGHGGRAKSPESECAGDAGHSYGAGGGGGTGRVGTVSSTTYRERGGRGHAGAVMIRIPA